MLKLFTIALTFASIGNTSADICVENVVFVEFRAVEAAEDLQIDFLENCADRHVRSNSSPAN